MIDNELRKQYRQAFYDLEILIKETCIYNLCKWIVRKLSKF